MVIIYGGSAEFAISLAYERESCWNGNAIPWYGVGRHLAVGRVPERTSGPDCRRLGRALLHSGC